MQQPAAPVRVFEHSHPHRWVNMLEQWPVRGLARSYSSTKYGRFITTARFLHDLMVLAAVPASWHRRQESNQCIFFFGSSNDGNIRVLPTLEPVQQTSTFSFSSR